MSVNEIPNHSSHDQRSTSTVANLAMNIDNVMSSDESDEDQDSSET